MLLDDDDIRDMVAAIGDDTIALLGTSELAVVFNPEGRVQLSGELLDRSGPYALASAADVAALSLAAGNDGDTLTINSIAYTVLAIDPDGQGGVVLSLVEEA